MLDRAVDEELKQKLTDAAQSRSYVVGQKTANSLINKFGEPKITSKTNFECLMESMNELNLLSINKFLYFWGDKQAVKDEDLHWNIKKIEVYENTPVDYTEFVQNLPK